MTKEGRGLEDLLRESWGAMRSRLPGDIGDYLDPRVAFQRIVVRNGKALLQELLESGEAVILLFKLARGGKLSAAESARLKEQLADMAKAVPALGIFALPGGALLLPILAKSLPWDLLPSAFKERLHEAAEEKEVPPKGRDKGEKGSV